MTSDGNWRWPLRWAKQARQHAGMVQDYGNAVIEQCKRCGARDCEPDEWRAPCREPERPRVFCASLADVFEDRPDLVEPRTRLLRLILQTPELDWLILTKRPENAMRMVGRWWWKGDRWQPNVWLGTSVACQEDADRNISALLEVPAAVRFVSYEPAVGPVDFTGWMVARDVGFECLDWLIVGGESGKDARPCDVEWIRSAVQQCKAAGVPVFVKQLGSKSTCGIPECNCMEKARGKSADPAFWAEDLRVREFPRRD